MFLKKIYKMIAKDLSKKQALDDYPKAIQQISFTGNLEKQSAIFLNTEEAKETVLDFPLVTVKIFCKKNCKFVLI